MRILRTRYKRIFAVILLITTLLLISYWKISLVNHAIGDNLQKVYLSSSSESKMNCYPHLNLQPSDIKVAELYEKIKFLDENGGKWKQGWDVSIKPTKQTLEVVILPHSHHDPGWIKTFDQYFEDQSKPSLDSTLDFLTKHDEARFIYAEVSFLNKWWSELTVSEKSAFTKLVQDGHWEIATGGWVMNDEAVSHYSAVAMQLTEGHQWLMDNLGYFPNVSWAIDPFGHSTSQAYLISKAGIKHMLIQRVHYELKKELAKFKNLEFRWRQPWDDLQTSEVFCHMMPFYSYDVPHTCGPDPSVCCQFDFLRLSQYQCPWNIQPVKITTKNIKERANTLADQYKKKASLYNNNNVVLIPLGDDFRFTSTSEWNTQISNYKRLIQYINSNQKFNMHVQFGTLSTYFNLVKKRTTINPETLIGDFFTYADRGQDYWSGYFTTRPTHKALSRLLETEIRCADLLFSISRHLDGKFISSKSSQMFKIMYEDLQSARRNHSLFQHHDGITGTSKTAVMLDYNNRMNYALQQARSIAAASLTFILGRQSAPIIDILQYEIMHKGPAVIESANLNWNSYTTPQPAVIIINKFDDVVSLFIFNTLTRQRDHTLSLTLDLSSVLKEIAINAATISVLLSLTNGVSLSTQLEPLPSILSPSLSSIKLNSKNKLHSGLFILRSAPIRLNGLEIVSVKLSLKITSSRNPALEIIQPHLYVKNDEPILAPYLYKFSKTPLTSPTLENNLIRLKFDRQSGFLNSFTNLRTHQSVPISINFEIYHSKKQKETSGAYIMIPQLPSVPYPTLTPAQMRYSRGPVVEELTVYHPHLEHTVRLYKSGLPNSIAFDVENVIDLNNPYNNDEVVMVIKSQIFKNDKTFYTDSNCLQFTERVYYDKIPLQGNVYPMSCAAYIEGKIHRMTILSAQSLGVTAGEKPGEIRLWLDRRLGQDDNRGVNQPILDNVPSRSLFRIVIETITIKSPVEMSGITGQSQFLLDDLIHPSAQFVVKTSVFATADQELQPGKMLMNPDAFPCNYHLVSLNTFYSSANVVKAFGSLPGSQLGMLLHHTTPYCGSTKLCSQCACSNPQSSTIDVSKLFPLLKLSAAVQTSLTFIPKKTDNKILNQINVKPMELEAFLLIFSQ